MCKGVLTIKLNNGHLEKIYDVKMNKKRQKLLQTMIGKKVAIFRSSKGRRHILNMRDVFHIDFKPGEK